jgi:hypothetical protein
MDALQQVIAAWPDSLVPGEIAALLRPHTAAVAGEMVEEIQSTIPEYARPDDDSYMYALHVGVQSALTCFCDVLEGGGDQRGSWREVYRALGAGEAREGRSLDLLQAAMRVGARVAWRRLIGLAERTPLPPRSLGLLFEATFLYLDEIIAACAEGYAAARSAEVGEMDRRRRRLLELLLADPPVPAEAIASASARAGWQLPRQISAVVLDEQSLAAAPAPMFNPEVLANLDRTEPVLILPDPDNVSQGRALLKALGTRRASVGPTVTPREAVKSLRWARTGLALAQRGVLPADGVVWCRDHLATLVLFHDEELLAELAVRRLAPLTGLPDRARELLSRTLMTWLQLDRNANEVAAHLHVHPQTVRYRLRQLDKLFGDDLRNPKLRFELEIALHARGILDRRSGAARA